MANSCSWTQRATAILTLSFACLATACGASPADSESGGNTDEQTTPTLYGGSVTTTSSRHAKAYFRNVVAPAPGPTSTSTPTPAPAGTPASDGTATPGAPTAPTETPAATPSKLPTGGTTTSTSLRGTNLVGMEGGYGFNTATGPVPNTDYAVHSNSIVDYLASRNINVIRLLFSWERMQSTLNGPIPAATSGNYKAYFDDFKRIVDYATNVKGMTVIMEPWQAGTSGDTGGPTWRGNLVGSGVVTSAHFADFWSKMAATFASNPRASIGLVNEPNRMSTMTWFAAAQAAVTAIRGAGFGGEILVPGNGWTGAGDWTGAGYDTASPQRSNAYGWLNARGAGQPLTDPLGKLVVGVHSYADANAGGGSTSIASTTISRDRVKVTVDWARANGLKVFIGEIGMYAGAASASANWSNFVSYLDANADTLTGFAWWGCGKPGWWDDVAASGGGHFSITPTGSYAVDTVNMTMIKSAFHP
jgi:endoglucanase